MYPPTEQQRQNDFYFHVRYLDARSGFHLLRLT